MSKARTHIMILSPHRDDAAFSCGLLLRSLCRRGCAISIVNVGTVSAYAPYLTQAGTDRIGQVSEARRIEDMQFADLLKRDKHADAEIGFVDLDWLDLPLRWNVEDDAALHPSSLHASEVDALRDVFLTLPSADVVIAPKALGGHLDHRLVSHAARAAFPKSSLALYEDLPYACSMEGAADATHPSETYGDQWVLLGEPAEGFKRELCLCYPSQIDPSLADTMESYGQSIGGERYRCSANVIHLIRTALEVIEEIA